MSKPNLEWLASLESKEAKSTVDASDMDNDQKEGSDKSQHDEASETEKNITATDIQIAIEEYARIRALTTTKDLPADPEPGDTYHVNGVDWIYQEDGGWVTMQGIYGHEHFDENGLNIEASGIDQKSGATKRYVVTGYNAQTNPAAMPGDNLTECVILMQNGLVPEVGVNGLTADCLIKIVKDLFEGYQAGPFACEENQVVINSMDRALSAIHQRFVRRKEQGTEGTYSGN
ncbi:hypothetical protein [Pseudomonas aeruginosa]|uniref:hypothetical protein n=1 Tax=Pseudomonas aeruginosa TaxID=287 RepID=UPI0010244FF5|nr:hypothetical protein [Pseudomonas aeruginosa]QOV08072.1 hypothetical protein [Pseudomonas phage vB_PaeM_kmuB]UNI71653.1 hypothetical protein Churi01_gp134 [Pseudomonas phage Churi01]UXD83200.1 hypothetical protein NP274_00148 [Pseudomonas phage Koomba boorn-mokiny kep-wari Wadjak 1]BBI55717.1 phage protein [Pseudomonas phage PA02]